MFDVTKMAAPKASAERISRAGSKRELGPNPWLDPKFAGNLQSSYDKGQAYELEFAGEVVDTVYKSGKNVGQPTQKVTGDAYLATVMIRDAATKLDLGVSVRTVPGASKGKVLVKWQAKDRKERKSAGNTVPPVPTAVLTKAAGVTK